MTAQDTLARLRNFGVQFTLHGRGVRYRAPENIRPEDRELITLYAGAFADLLDAERAGRRKKIKRSPWPEKIADLGYRRVEGPAECYLCPASTRTRYGVRPLCQGCANQPDVALRCRHVPYLLACWDMQAGTFDADPQRRIEIVADLAALVDEIGPTKATTLRDLWVKRRMQAEAEAAHRDHGEGVGA